MKERRQPVEKIVISTDQPEPDKDLLACLHELFPDCEIQIVFKRNETFGGYPANCFHFQLKRTRQSKIDGEHFKYRWPEIRTIIPV
jgi:hypothetical protein